MNEETPALAAVDLGSTSFHVVVARATGDDLIVLDRAREGVQIAAGLDANRRLSDDAMARSLACLERFGQRLRGLPPDRVRAVGTNTLRVARNARTFRERAEKALGHYVEVVSGTEEARLIYLGVAHSIPPASGTRLVIDIGGGSTECILGRGFEPLRANSLYMGCVSWSRQFFPGGELSAERMRHAELAAGLEFQAIAPHFRGAGWESAVGASGTIEAVESIARANGWSEAGISAAGLRRVRRALLGAGRVDRLTLPGLRPERAPVLPGGVAILLAAFEHLGIDVMTTSPGALREGLLYDILGRIRHEDVRDRTIRNLMERYQVDAAQATRVEETALRLYDEVAAPWDVQRPELRHHLAWAARLHELGLVVGYTGYHKHGAYLIANSEMPGFSRDDQEFLAALVREHRRKLNRPAVEGLTLAGRRETLRLAAALRLAVLLNRGRGPFVNYPSRVEARGDRLSLSFPPGWLDEHPLTRADLEEEKGWLGAAGVKLAWGVDDKKG